MVGTEPQVRAGEYDYLDVDNWEIKEYIKYGWWLEALVKPPERTKSLLSERLMTRAYHFGIGAPVHRIKSEMRFGSMSNYYQRIKILPKYEANKFDDWTQQDLAGYVEQVFLDLSEASNGDTSIALEIQRRSMLGLGPSLDIVLRKGERIMKLLALRGYADSRAMSREEHVSLGVRFARANNGAIPTEAAYDKLAKSRRTPTWRTIYNKFDSVTIFKERVTLAYQAMIEADRQILAEIRQAREEQRVSPLLFQGASDNKEIINRYHKWQVITLLLPGLPTKRKIEVAGLKDPETFKSVLRSYNGIKTMQIEEAIEQLGVGATIFEDTSFMHYLHVS